MFFAAYIVQFGSISGGGGGAYYERAGIIGLPCRLPVVDSLSAVYVALIYIDGNSPVGVSCFTSCEHFDSD